MQLPSKLANIPKMANWPYLEFEIQILENLKASEVTFLLHDITRN